MSAQVQKSLSITGGDPALLNRIAWTRRWTDREISTEYAEVARKAAKNGSDGRCRVELGLALRTLGWQALWRGNLKRAMEYCLRAETCLPESKHPEVRAGLYVVLATVHRQKNRLDLASSAVERGLWLLSDFDDGPELADLYMTRAAIQRQAGEFARAGITLSKARELATGEQMTAVEIFTAVWIHGDGDIEKALRHALTGLETAVSMSNRLILPYARAICAGCFTSFGDHVEASEHISEGLKIAEEDGDSGGQCILLMESAKLARSMGNVDAQIRHLAEASELARKMEFFMRRKEIALSQAKAHEAKGNYKAALEQHNIAWRLQNETRVR